ncbi:MAG: translation initiation factor IF-2 [Synechococcales bacterium]|nr:translation initiation factor IF-2 [Synechococcales bacterium]
MNNGKVRIYELSKELKLDNRDILAVCDELNISVKSHSSTITETDASRIRAAAEKYASSRPSAPDKRRTSSSNNSAQSAQSPQGKPGGSKAPVKKKQQILEIRKRKPGQEPQKRPAELISKPRVPQTQSESTNPPSERTRVPNRPPQAPRPDSDIAPPPNQPTPPRSVEPVSANNDHPAASDISDIPDSNGRQELAAVEKPKLISPPARPQAGSSIDVLPDEVNVVEVSDLDVDNIDADSIEVEDIGVDDTRAAVSPPSPPEVRQSERPMLKRPVDRSSPSQPSRSAEGQQPRPIPTGNSATASRSGSEAATSPPKLKRPVVRPTAPSRPSKPATTEEAPTEDDTETDAIAIDLVETGLELRRPIAPKPKREKRHQDEEDEEQEIPKKAKVAKGKRRALVIDDEEEEDLEGDEDSDNVTPSQISISLMRPPKPKNLPGQQPKPTPTLSRRKPQSRDASRSQRRDRRDQEKKQERPEMITLRGEISVHDLAERLVVPETEIIKKLFFQGIAANINQILDIPTATAVAQEFDVVIETGEQEAEAKKVTEMLDAADLDYLERRPPVVTIMGHVDHGKTTLLDSIRKTKVAQGEAGGITQHIGAYHVDVEHEGEAEQVVFLDTPGHEAFTAMRARGARVTDIAVLVVAADDGVRPQTIEAIRHAQAAEVPIVVAINKIDKEEAQPDRVKQELMEYSLVPEEWGGETIMVPVSALQGENLDTLLEMLLLVAEVEDLHANPNRPAKGTVIEANLDKARGPVATLLVQNGTLRVGDVLVAGSVFGKVRAMIDDRSRRVSEASPSFAVEVLGLGDVPAAGDEFEVFLDEKEARSIADSRMEQQRQTRLQQTMASRRVSLSSLSAQAQEGDLKELNIILKADVQGSVEAILASLQQLPQKEVQVRVLLSAPGEVTETDVDLAAASGAVIVGFNTTLASGARQAADQAGVDIREYDIIYKLLEDIQGAMEGLLEPEMVEEALGQVEVRAVFPVGRGAVAGCYVQSGKAIRNCRIRVTRGNEVVYTGNLDSLKRVKDDVKEVNAGYECGIGVDNFNGWQEGDIISTFRLVSKRRTLSA